jgi:hypothetical protein
MKNRKNRKKGEGRREKRKLASRIFSIKSP